MARKDRWRRQYEIDKFRHSINDRLQSGNDDPLFRLGMIKTLEMVLHDSGTYGGWEYTEEAGITYEERNGRVCCEIEDPTRRHYYSMEEVEHQAADLLRSRQLLDDSEDEGIEIERVVKSEARNRRVDPSAIAPLEPRTTSVTRGRRPGRPGRSGQ